MSPSLFLSHSKAIRGSLKAKLRVPPDAGLQRTMSKQNASTMSSLKDFHGSFIPPHNLNLPTVSAPAVKSKSECYIAPTWGSTIARSDFLLQSNSGYLDEIASFLSYLGNIDQNFDEDERKRISSACRSGTTDTIHSASLVHQELKSVHLPSVTPSDIQRIKSVSQTRILSTVSLVEGDSNIPSGNNGQADATSNPNTSETNKEVIGGCKSAATGSNAVSVTAQLSSVEKASSEKWQSKIPLHLLPHMIYSCNDVKSSALGSLGDSDATQRCPAEQGLSAGGDQGDNEEVPGIERIAYSVPTGQTEANPCASRAPSIMHSEVSERPKLKLLPRTKPLENKLEKEFKQVGTVGGIHTSADTLKQGSAINESENQSTERPKLSLKPRSQSLEQSEGATEAGRYRSSLFGGARPRELVLEEQGAWETRNARRNRHRDGKLKPASSDNARACQVKGASASELAPSISRSVFDPKPTQFSGRRNMPAGHNHVSFSRLTDSELTELCTGPL